MAEKFSQPHDGSTTMAARLKQATWPLHRQLESLPYFKAVADRRLPIVSYVNQLRALSVIHGVLEREISELKELPVSAVWHDDLRKLPLLEADLRFFEPRGFPDAAPPIQAALALAEYIRLRREEQPVSLLGALYVLEGSTLGNSVHAPDIAATFQLNSSDGCRYYAGYGDEVHNRWSDFKSRLNSALPDSRAHDSVVDAAREIFDGLQGLYETLHPLATRNESRHISRINPEAGNHPIPQDDREIEAALRASEQTWQAFPYYEHRYGDRGKRFSDSDLCWIVTLVSLDQDSLNAQITWLARLLTTRGMPSVMLQDSLIFLYDALLVAIPEKAAQYAKLRVAAEQLAARRTERISDDDVEALSDAFDQMISAEQADRHAGMGRLLVCAVIDEKNGVMGALDAIRTWSTDDSRFGEDWIEAVNALIEMAQNMAS